MEKIDIIKTILDSNAVASCGGHFVGAVISGSFWNTVAIKLIIEFELPTEQLLTESDKGFLPYSEPE